MAAAPATHSTARQPPWPRPSAGFSPACRQRQYADLVNASAFSIGVDAWEPTLSAGIAVPAALNNGTTTNRGVILVSSTAISGRESVTAVAWSIGTLAANTRFNAVASFTAGAQTTSLNGAAQVAKVTPAISNPPGLTTLKIGQNAVAS